MQKNIVKKGLVFAVIVLFICMSIPPSFAVDNVKKSSTYFSDGNTLYVGGSGPNNYSKIKDAINVAVDGDTVFVYNGNYYEYDIFINKSINLIGFSKYNVIINGHKEGDEDVITITSNNVLIENFTIKGTQGYQAGDSCIRVESINNIINNNILEESHSGVLVYVDNGPNYISNCSMYDNFFSGVYIDHSRDCFVENCYFKNCYQSIYICCSSYNKILNCSFESNYIYLLDGEYNLIENCNLSDCGIELKGVQDGNIIKYCKIYSKYYYGIYYSGPGLDNIVEDCVISVTSNNPVSAGIRFFYYSTRENFKVINCTIENAARGINFYWGTDVINCLISNCRFLNNSIAGIEFFWQETKGFNVYNCSFENNNYGICAYENYFSGSNEFYYNNFIGNTINFYDKDSITYLNAYKEFKENYWDDYTGTDADGDGIGDTPYIVGIKDKDSYPLMEPYPIFDPDVPYAPSITGLKAIKPGKSYEYSFVSMDPNDDNIYYYVTWGDGTYEEWVGPYNSGELIILNHTWINRSKYPIITRVKDVKGLISPWGTFEVTVPRTKASMSQLFLRFLELFPLLERLLFFLNKI